MTDDIAIVADSEDVMWGVTMPLAGKTEHLRFSAVWMIQGGEWREIARHANVVPHNDSATLETSSLYFIKEIAGGCGEKHRVIETDY